MSTWINFRELRQQLRFEDILEYYGVRLRHKGRQAQGFCPLPTHDGQRRSPSFSVNLERKIWRCFGCGAAGNLLDFATRMDGLDPADAQQVRRTALKLQQIFGTSPPPRRQNEDDARPRRMKRRKHRRDGRNEAIADMSSDTGSVTDDNALSSPTPSPEISRQENAVAAITDGPADAQAPHEPPAPTVINPPLAFELKRLDPEHPYLRSRGLAPQTARHFGLGYCATGLMAGRIAIPLHDVQGQLIGYAGRWVDDTAIGEATPKYLFPSRRQRDGCTSEFRKSMFLYNGHRLTTPVSDLIVVEGFVSCWWLWQHGHGNVVALMGSVCSDEQARLIIQAVHPQGRVWIFPDADDAGQRCAVNVLELISPWRFCRHVRIKKGQPTDLGPDELTRLLTP